LKTGPAKKGRLAASTPEGNGILATVLDAARELLCPFIGSLCAARLCSSQAANTISGIPNDLPDCLAGRPDAFCCGYAWQLPDDDVSRPGTSSAAPDWSELLEFPPVKHRKA
jgi:hypothetical protein